MASILAHGAPVCCRGVIPSQHGATEDKSGVEVFELTTEDLECHCMVGTHTTGPLVMSRIDIKGLVDVLIFVL